jgi:predicted  nucleic acid-binding Zn-ribbon protein
VTTSIDDLVKYLNEHGETESSELANMLGVGEAIVEAWADALEKAKIVRITYRVGRMYVALEAAGGVGVGEVKKTVELKKNIAATEVTAQINMINQMNAKIEEFKHYQTSAEEVYKSKAPEVKTALDSINRLDSQLEAAYRRLKGRKDYIDGLVGEMNKSMVALNQPAAAPVRAGGDEEARALIADMRERISDAEEMIGKLDKEFDRAVASSRRSFSELLDGLREENASMKRLVFQRQKEVEDLTSQSRAYERESEAVRRRAARERERMLDEITKSSAEVGGVYAAADKKISLLRGVLAEMKGGFGGFADLGDKLDSIKEGIAGAEKERDDLAKQLSELSDQLRAIDALDRSDFEKRAREMEAVDAKLADAGKQVGRANAGLGKIKKDIDEISK